MLTGSFKNIPFHSSVHYSFSIHYFGFFDTKQFSAEMWFMLSIRFIYSNSPFPMSITIDRFIVTKSFFQFQLFEYATAVPEYNYTDWLRQDIRIQYPVVGSVHHGVFEHAVQYIPWCLWVYHGFSEYTMVYLSIYHGVSEYILCCIWVYHDIFEYTRVCLSIPWCIWVYHGVFKHTKVYLLYFGVSEYTMVYSSISWCIRAYQWCIWVYHGVFEYTMVYLSIPWYIWVYHGVLEYTQYTG